MRFRPVCKKLIAVILAAAFVIMNSGAGALCAETDNTVRMKNATQCVDEFIKSLPEGSESKSFQITEAGVLRQPAWLEDVITTEMVAKKIIVMEKNADFILDYKLVEDTKYSVKIGFKLVDGKTDRVISYTTLKGGEQKVEKINYEHRVPRKPFVKTEGTHWGLIALVGMVVVGLLLQPKI
jgi:hypothetical protein